jgi:hypothetical protein
MGIALLHPSYNAALSPDLFNKPALFDLVEHAAVEEA